MFNFIKKQIKKHLSGRKSCSGFSMLELLLASAVGSIVIAGGYTSFVIIGKQYQRISSFSQVQNEGLPTIRVISRDLRMAGRVAMDTNVDPIYGVITTPITISDTADPAFDTMTIVYDIDSTVNPKRCQITYSVAARTNPARNALFMTVATLNSDPGDLCTGDSTSSLVADYVEDLQFVGSDTNSDGNFQIVDIALVTRSRSTLPRVVTYTKPNQTAGNNNYTFTDNFHRDEFTATINIKNVRE